MIYRITNQADWSIANAVGHFASDDLAAEGFIHCSELTQILRTANKYFGAASELVLLQIDEALLGNIVVREDLQGSGVFPHVYAAVPLAAIVGVHTMERDAAGVWVLPGKLV